MDNTVYRPTEGSRYELTFEPEGVLLVQVDCNRGRGSWKETLPAGIEFDTIATTRIACPPGSLDTPFLGDLGYPRSFVIKDRLCSWQRWRMARSTSSGGCQTSAQTTDMAIVVTS